MSVAFFLIDENLPLRIMAWRGIEYDYVPRTTPSKSDDWVWRYALQNRLVIVTKDADFTARVQVLGGPPRVVRFIFRKNLKIRAMNALVNRVWASVRTFLQDERVRYVTIDQDGTVLAYLLGELQPPPSA